MDAEKIDRINALYHKSQSVGLTEEEKNEQAALRKEYIEAVRRNLRGLVTSDVTKAGFGGICHTFVTGYKNGVMPGHRNIPMSALRQFLLLTFHHDVMSICQEENGRSYCKYESFS